MSGHRPFTELTDRMSDEAKAKISANRLIRQRNGELLDENDRLRAALYAVNACLVDEGGYPRFAVRHGTDFDAACGLVRDAIADFR